MQTIPPIGILQRQTSKTASGKILSFIDDDTILTPGWGEAIHKAFHLHKCDVVAGTLLPPKTYKNIIKGSKSRYVARGITVYNTWFTCRFDTVMESPELMIISPRRGRIRACASGLWGASLSIKSSFYKKIIDQIEMSKLGYVGGRSIGGDDTKIIMNSFYAGGKVCLSLRAAQYHYTEPHKMTRKYILRKYSYIIETNRYLLKTRGDRKTVDYLTLLEEGFYTIMKEVLNDLSIKPFSILDTASIVLLSILKRIMGISFEDKSGTRKYS